MEAPIVIEKYSDAAQQINRHNTCESSEIQRMSWMNQVTQVESRRVEIITSTYANPALNRLKIIETYPDEEIFSSVFKNTQKAIRRLNNYIKFLDPDEIGPSGNGTILMNFENKTCSIMIEIGSTTIAHVYYDNANTYISGSSKFGNNKYWDKLIELFNNVFSS